MSCDDRDSGLAALAASLGPRLGPAATFATTEHFNLQTARAITVSEANGRTVWPTSCRLYRTFGAIVDGRFRVNTALQTRFAAELGRIDRDFATVYSTAPIALRPEIRLYDHQTGPFQDGHKKIKHTYVAGVIQYDDIPE